MGRCDRHVHFGDQFVLLQHRLVVAREQFLDGSLRSPSGPTTINVVPSAISTGGRSMCGSPWASAPPTVATLRTRTFDNVRKVWMMSGACFFTSAERSSRRERRHRADAKPPGGGGDAGISAFDLAQADELCRAEHAGLHHQHQCSAAGDRPDRRVVGVEQPTAAASDVGSASSNGVIGLACKCGLQPCGELLLHVLCLRAEHRLADASKLAGQRRIRPSRSPSSRSRRPRAW